jgi:DNA-binding NtrC family response regulator
MAPRILVIEDDDALRSEISDFLQRRRHHVRACATIAEAAQALADETPDIVMSDINLPDGDGAVFCMANAGKHPGATWLLMSGHSDLVQQSRQLKRDPDAPPFSVLSKPVPLRVLDDFVRLAMVQKNTTQQVA